MPSLLITFAYLISLRSSKSHKTYCFWVVNCVEAIKSAKILPLVHALQTALDEKRELSRGEKYIKLHKIEWKTMSLNCKTSGKQIETQTTTCDTLLRLFVF